MSGVPKIKVFGFGETGSSVIDKLIKKGFSAVEYCAVERNSKKDLPEAVNGADMVVIVAGLDGVSSAATSVIAGSAKENKVLTISAVCAPISGGDERRKKDCESILAELKEKSDSTVVISCDNIKSDMPTDIAESKVAAFADNLLCSAVSTVISVVVESGVINIDFEDAVTVFKDSDDTYFGIGVGSGNGRIAEAVRHSLNFTPSQAALDNKDRAIIFLEGGQSLNMDDVSKAANLMRSAFGKNANIQFAVKMHDSLSDEILVSVIATQSRIK